MQFKIIEATNGFNWGKFLVCQFDEADYAHVSPISGQPVLAQRGWSRDHVWVLDLETREGAAFRLGGSPRADLQKHRVWVCPLFEPFLEWLYHQNLDPLDQLPTVVELPLTPGEWFGYRRPGHAHYEHTRRTPMTPHREFGHADDCPHNRRNWDATAPDLGERIEAEPDCACGRAGPHAHCTTCGNIVWFPVGKYPRSRNKPN